MMFKKKSNLPPRPKFPTSSQLIEDLSLTTNDDPLFITAKTIAEKKSKTEFAQKQDAVYEKIEKFFVMHDELQSVMKNLETLDKSLKEKEIEVIKLTENLKEQAFKAVI